ncbi:MAG: entericidin [Verrucomicrobiota bacterium]
MKLSKLFAALGLLFSLCALSACNTIGGAGDDLEAAGEAISDEAEDAS